jgi:hypothetical protein
MTARTVQHTLASAGLLGLVLLAAPGGAQTPTASRENTMSTQVQSAAPAASQARNTAADAAIRPFRVRVPEPEVAELRRRLSATRWPDRETVPDRSQGARLAGLQGLVRYWATDYDWRRAEAKLNAHPQFMTVIDGVDVHFFHVRSRHPEARPLIVTHG